MGANISFKLVILLETMSTEKDPWDWTIDEVVHYLFGPNGLLLEFNLTESATSNITNLIRESETDGYELLLSTYDPSDPQAWLSQVQIRSQRRKLEHVIEDLRFRSEKYIRYLEKKSQQAARFEPFSAIRDGLGHHRSTQQSPAVSKASSVYFKAEQPTPRSTSMKPCETRQPLLSGNRDHQTGTDASTNGFPSALVQDDTSINAPDKTSDPPLHQMSNSKRVLSSDSITEPFDDKRSSIHNADAIVGANGYSKVMTQPEPQLRENETFVTDEHGRKRRKLALTMQNVSGLYLSACASDGASTIGGLVVHDQRTVAKSSHSEGDGALPLPDKQCVIMTSPDNAETEPHETMPNKIGSFPEIEPKEPTEGLSLIAPDFTSESDYSPQFDPIPYSDVDEDALLCTALEEQPIQDKSGDDEPLGAVQEETANPQDNPAGIPKSSSHSNLTVPLKHKRRLQPELIGLVRAEYRQPDFLATETIETTPTLGMLDIRGVTAASSTQTQWYAGRRSRSEYLGQQALPVDQVFYGNTVLGKPVIHDNSRITQQLAVTDKDDHNFHFASDGAISTGQRLYVSSLMRGFLGGNIIKDLIYGEKHLTAIVPYHARISKRFQQSSMTLLTESGEGLIARRVNRAHWLKHDSANGISHASPCRNLNTQTLEVEVEKEDSPLLSIGRNEVHDYDFLQKWEQQAENYVLPVYGDSGSEGEYDLDTWHEMEVEKGRLDRVPAPPSQSRLLRAKRIEEIMDDAERAFQERWRLRKLPKLEPKAWSLWRSRRSNAYRDRLQLFVSEIRRLDFQFLKIKKEIRKEQWTSEAKLKAQCRSFEVSVTDRETCRWKVGILQSDSEPAKLLLQQRSPKSLSTHLQKPLQEPLQDGEEDVGSSSMEDESSDDDVDDFIVSDDESNEPDISGDLSSSEDNTYSPDNRDVERLPIASVLTAESQTTASRRNMLFRKKATPPEQDAVKLEPVSKSPVPNIEKSFAGKTKSPKKDISSSEFIPIALSSSPVRPSVPDIIDLTNLSDVDEPTPQPGKRIATPPVFFKAEAEDPFSRPTNAKSGFRMPPPASSELDSGMESTTVGKPSPNVSFDKLPPLHEVSQIAKLDPERLKEAADRERLLIWIIGNAGTAPRRAVVKLLKAQKNMAILQSYIWAGMRALGKGTDLPEDLTWDELSIDQAQAYMRLATWFICWSQCAILFPEGSSQNSPAFAKKDVDKAIDNEAKFVTFHNALNRCLQHFADKLQSKLMGSSPSASASQSQSQKKRIRRVASESEGSGDNRATKRKKRVYEVPESQQALEMQRFGKQRIEQQNKRQKEMDERMRRLGETGDVGHAAVRVVNTTAGRDQGIVIVPRHISLKIQAHQLDGVRFMWREVVAADQGCLLAHTMGLGKTMQVITLLVTIAQAAKSEDESIQAQIPERLKSSKTLILAPATLVDNWFDEFLMWAPDRSESIGEVHKVSSDLKPEARLSEIELWDKEGGVLLMGYDGFRNFVNILNPKGSKSKNQKPEPERVPRVDEERYKILIDVLLTHPNIVVLDEAHTVKRSSSKISQAVAQFQTTNRIALTGSPLSNNLEEYYELISWINPGYLGTRPEFRAKFVEPITSGLYAESTAYEKRTSLMKLRTLSIQLEPKMQRQDISVLKKQLSKTEFVVYVPLTSIQRDAYVLYAQVLLSATRGKDPPPSRIWGALSVLRLLCNHPQCFRDKLEAAKKELREAKKGIGPVSENPDGGVVDDDNESVPDDAAEAANDLLPNIGMTEDMMNQQLQIFKSVGKSIARIDLSNKMLVLMRIIAFSEEAEDKVLVFSHSISTLNFIEKALRMQGHRLERLDGTTPMKSRNQLTKRFNTGRAANICLISTRAGGQGLNLYGANRVVIVDDTFNPMHEEQAIGRAYRIGQEKHVYVYRLTVGGTFEETTQNQSLFKVQLATRVVDKKHNNRFAMSSLREYLRVPKELVQKDLTDLQGKDELVLDRVLADAQTSAIIRSIIPSETFKDLEPLTAEEEKEVEENVRLENLLKTDPVAYRVEMDKHERALQQKAFSDIRAQDQAEFLDTTPKQSADLQPPTAPNPDQSNHAPQVYPRNPTGHTTAHWRVPVTPTEHSQQPPAFSDRIVPISNGFRPGTSSTETRQIRDTQSPSLSVSSRPSVSSLGDGSKDSTITEQQRTKYRDRICNRMIQQLPKLAARRIFSADNAAELCKRFASRMEKVTRQKADENSQVYRRQIHDIEKWAQNDIQRLGKALQVEKKQAKVPTGSLAGKPSDTAEFPGTTLSQPISEGANSLKRASLSARPARTAIAEQTTSMSSDAAKDVEDVGSSMDGASDKQPPSSGSAAPKVRPTSAQLSMPTPSSPYPSLQALLAREQRSPKLLFKR